MKTESQIQAKIIAKCRKIIECDAARISKPNDTMFFIIGFKKSTKDDKDAYWVKNGKRIDFDYLQENVIAHGKTEKELIASVKEYKRLCGITWEQYFKELRNEKRTTDTSKD